MMINTNAAFILVRRRVAWGALREMEKPSYFGQILKEYFISAQIHGLGTGVASPTAVSWGGLGAVRRQAGRMNAPGNDSMRQLLLRGRHRNRANTGEQCFGARTHCLSRGERLRSCSRDLRAGGVRSRLLEASSLPPSCRSSSPSSHIL